MIKVKNSYLVPSLNSENTWFLFTPTNEIKIEKRVKTNGDYYLWSNYDISIKMMWELKEILLEKKQEFKKIIRYKLNLEDKLMIKYLYNSGMSRTEISKKYDVSKSRIDVVLNEDLYENNIKP